MKKQVLQLLRQGYSRKTICEKLHISKRKFSRIKLELEMSNNEPTKEVLEQLYIKQNLSIKKLSQELKICKNHVVRLLEKHQISKSSALVKLSQIESNRETYATGIPQEKIRQTLVKNHGTHSIMSIEEFKNKAKQTCITKYGVEHFSKTSEFKEKFTQTSKLKYGTEHPSQCVEVANKMSKGIRQAFATGLPQAHCTETKHLNNSFNTSQPEEQAYQMLLEHFSKEDILRQYKTIEYPFNCDFYIKSLDLYIEYQGSWCHGHCPFDPTNETHQKLVQKWGEKDTEYYIHAIETWTKSDPEKRKIAQERSLNWKEFFSLEDLQRWLSDYTNTDNKTNKEN